MQRFSQPSVYDKRPHLAFQEGFYERVKVKRHHHQKYDRYHYYLPARLSPVIRFLKKYFLVLDPLCEVDNEKDRIRQTEFEFAETAILILHHIRCRIAVSKPIVVGSERFSPCPWAVFGPTLGVANKLMKHHFLSLRDVFRHYDDFMWGSGYNIVNIERPHKMHPEMDGLAVLGDIYNRSANYILATGLLLLCDLIKHCGPDSGEFNLIFTNDKQNKWADMTAWEAARYQVIPPDFEQLKAKALCGRSNTRQRFGGLSAYHRQQQRPRKPKQVYFDVEIRDACISSHFDLTRGETFEVHGESKVEVKPKRQTPLLLPYYGDPDLSPDDVDEDNENDEIAQMDREFRRIVGDSPPVTPKQHNDYEWLRGWHGLD